SDQNQESRRRDAWNTRYKAKDNGRRPGKQEKPKALVTLDGDGVYWTSHAEDEQENFALMAYSNSGARTLRSSVLEDSPVHDRFVNVEGMHAVPPLIIGNYMPSGPDREVDDSMFTYGPKQSITSESDTQTSNFDSCESNSSVETLESVPKPVVVEPKVVSQTKVWFDAPIIEEYESDSDDEYVIQPSKEKERPRYGFTKKACFVCGSFSHLIRNCDVHEKRMAKQVELNKKKAVLTRTGRIPINTARHNFNSQALSTSDARKVIVVRPIVNDVRQKTIFHKTHTPIRRPFNITTAPKANFSNQKVNTAKVKAVSAVGDMRETAVQQVVIGDPKDITGTRSPNTIVDQALDNPQRALKNKGIVDSGCSRHMTGNKAYLVEYQDYNGGPVAFGGSKGYITGKGKIKTGKLDFEDVCFVKELQHFNLFSVSQMCDKKNKVLFTDSECLVLSPEFKLPDENQVLLRIPRQNNIVGSHSR
ncbi:hypothetical protein Tco_1444737, partial [Tanacetum coccineum]